MRRFQKDPKHPSVANALTSNSSNPIAQQTLFAATEEQPLKLIPWSDIWSSLRVARVRGNGEMIEVFYDTLFKEAIFDDRGAWSWNSNKRN